MFSRSKSKPSVLFLYIRQLIPQTKVAYRFNLYLMEHKYTYDMIYIIKIKLNDDRKPVRGKKLMFCIFFSNAYRVKVYR